VKAKRTTTSTEPHRHAIRDPGRIRSLLDPPESSSPLNRRTAVPLTLTALALVPLLWAAVRSDRPDAQRRAPVAADTPRIESVPGMPADVQRLLRDGRYWRASRRLRDVVGPGSAPELVLAAAESEARWGGWPRVRTLLEGVPWLERVGGGEGWYLLGRALEETDRSPEAVDAYGRYLRNPEAARAAVAALRLARLHLRAGRLAEGSAAMDRLRSAEPAAAGWANVLAAEALASRGDTAAVRALLQPVAGMPGGRAAAALAESYRVAGAPAAAGDAALRFAVAGHPPADQAAALAAAGRAVSAVDAGAARSLFRRALGTDPGSRGAGEAADAFERLGGMTADDRLLVGETFIRRGEVGRGASHLAAGLAAGGGQPAQRDGIRLRAGRAAFVARRYAEAVAVLAPLTASPTPAGAEALYYTGRAQLRGGPGSSRGTFEALAARHPSTAWAGDGIYLLADLEEDAGRRSEALAGYRRVVERHPGSPNAGLAAARLGADAMQRGYYRGAAVMWDGLRAHGATPEAKAQAAYWAGRAYAAAGDAEVARERWQEARRLAPVSYYAVLAARRLGVSYWPPQLAPAPPLDPDRSTRAATSLRAAEVLRDAGLHAEADAEVERLVGLMEDVPAAKYALAEALAERGWTVYAVRIGRAMEAAGEPMNRRLLGILYPFHHRGVLAAEARERGLDPFLVAALTRQESVFKARAQSPAGARGLMQVMPGTGRGLAAGAGISDWDAELLYDPEINAHLGTRYLAAQMRAYQGNLPYVFSAYNAGPGRVTRWRRFPEARDPEMFTERIPFEETREYVKILTRNIALYRGLYGG
jgi:soluble lytic murein transglycosylase